MNIFVGNLNYRLGTEELEQRFAEYGQVDSVKIITDRETGRAKGFGFVEMPNDNEAQAAIDELNGSELMGRAMVVNQARPRN
ncbi:MAG: RNA-binding protein [Salibacteraceae bacterium]